MATPYVLDTARPATQPLPVPVRLALPGWRLSRAYRLWRLQPRGRLGPYYVEWNELAEGNGGDSDAHFDPAGVLLASQRAYDPVRIAQYALDEHRSWVTTKAERSRDSFLSQARWLRDRAGVDGTLPMPFGSAKYGARAGYMSAKAQSEAISVLLRAEEIMPDGGFLQAAERAAIPMRRSIGQGGVLWRNSSGDSFFEDVATSTGVHLLEGCIVGCWGPFELQRVTQSGRLQSALGPTIATLQRRLAHYDSGGFWSFGSALVAANGFRSVSTLRAHDLHIALLHVLASMTGDSYFSAVALAWSDRVGEGSTRRRVMTNLSFGAIARRLRVDDSVGAGAKTLF